MISGNQTSLRRHLTEPEQKEKKMKRIVAFTLILMGFMMPVALAQQPYSHDQVA